MRRSKPAARKAKTVRKPSRRQTPTRAARQPVTARAGRPVQKAPAKPPTKPAAATTRPPVGPSRVERDRRRLPDDERLMAEEKERENVRADDRMMASARSGARELAEDLTRHTETGPALAGGDLDARWQDAYAVGDEAPGGDNPTPDQDRVDDIGKALGVVYNDNEELEGAEKIAERDRHRWELDPASSDDWPHDKDR